MFRLTIPTSFLAALASTAMLHAVPITWSAARDTTGKSQLIEGSIMLSLSGGSAATISGGGNGGAQNYSFTGVNYQGIAFLPAPGARTESDVSAGSATTGDVGFDTILKSVTDSSSGITTGTQTIGGLTPGTHYRVQVFYNDQRGSYNSRVMTYGDGEASENTIDLLSGGGDWGRYAVGFFTAGASSQPLTHTANGFNNVHFNAILVTEAGPPSPPEVPTGLAVTPGNNRNTLEWDENIQPGFLEFRIMRSTSMGGPYTLAGTSTGNQFADTTAVNGTNYYYVVTTVNVDSVESAQSAEEEGEPEFTIEPPNFLFIITDDMDTYTVNAYRESEPVEPNSSGQAYPIDTPNIDRLAAEGMLFHQARLMGADYAAVCTPSRTCIMSGKNTWERTQGVSAAVTFPGIFNRGARSGLSDLPHATYRTCKSGNSYPTANGEFTVVNDQIKRGNTPGEGSEWHGDKGLEHLEHWRTNHRPNGKPFLMYLGFSHPHDERNAQGSLVSRYGCANTTDPGSLVLNPNSPPLPFNHLPVNQALGIPANYPFHPFDNGHLGVRDEKLVPGMLTYRTEAVVRNEQGRNFACVDWIDQQLGRVLAKLEDPDGDGDKSDSVLENTYIVFTSDHGIAVGRHGLQGKQNLYEHTWRVPYIVRGPGIEAGSETDALVYLHDSFPTLCDLAGINVPATIDGNDGQSFKAVLEGTSDSHREALYGLYAGGSLPGMRAVTNGRFKLLKYDVGSNATQVTQLFDLETNPFELLPEHGVPNIATDPAYAAVRQDLEEMLMEQRIFNADPHAFLGDRTLLRFEDGAAGESATTVIDRLPFENDGTTASGTGGSLPAFSSDVPHPSDFVVGEANTLSLDLEQDAQNHVLVPDARELDFGNAPFTIEAWVKLETMPTGSNLASAMPLVMKKVIGTSDSNLDYMFFAAAGSAGGSTNYDKLAVRFASAPILSSLAIPDTNWHYISVALDPVAGVVRFVLDDQIDVINTNETGTANGGPLVIGAHFNGSGVIDSSFDGLIDELSITDGFLDLSELQPLSGVADVDGFSISDVTLDESGETLDISFGSSDTRLYNVERSATLLPGSWTRVRTHIPGAAGADQTTVSGLPRDSPATREFFRVTTVEGL